MDSDPYLVSLARQGRRRFPEAAGRRAARPPAAAEPVADERDEDPYLTGLARGTRGRAGDPD